MNITKMLTFLTKKENFQSDFIVFIIIILSSFFLYFKSFFHNFIQDDYVLIESVHHGINLQNIFIIEFFTGNDFYRPITRKILFYIAYKFFHLNAFEYHIIIFIAFILIAFIVYQIIKSLSRGTELAIIVSVLFFISRGSHFTELYWISAGFQETFTALFILSACIFFIYYLQNRNRYLYLASILLTITALLSKESAISLPLIIALIAIYYYFSEDGHKLKSLIKDLVPFGIILGIYLIHMLYTQLMFRSSAYSMSFDLTTIFSNISFYFYHTFNGLIEAVFLLSIIAIVLLEKKRWKLAIFGVAWFCISILPYLFLVDHTYSYYLSVALVGPAILVCAGLISCQDKIGKYCYPLAAILVFIMFMTSYFSISEQEMISPVTTIEKISNNVIGYLNNNFKKFPHGSLIYIENPDQNLYWALGFGSAIRLYFGEDKAVYFENITQGEPPVRNHTYYFYYSNNTIIYLYKKSL